jgi:hypothetical protein
MRILITLVAGLSLVLVGGCDTQPIAGPAPASSAPHTAGPIGVGGDVGTGSTAGQNTSPATGPRSSSDIETGRDVGGNGGPPAPSATGTPRPPSSTDVETGRDVNRN